MSHLPTLETAKLAGITVRHCQRLLSEGAIPDAVRTSGGHWRIEDTPALRKWCRDFKRWGGKVVKPAVRRKAPQKPLRTTVSVPPVKSAEDALERATAAVSAARKALEVANAESVLLGVMLWEESETRRGIRWSQWLAEIGISPQDARRLVNLAKDDEKHQRIDTPRLKNLGIMDVRKGRPLSGKKMKLSGWVAASGVVRADLDDLLKKKPLSQWHLEERESVADQLKPIVEIHRKLECR